MTPAEAMAAAAASPSALAALGLVPPGSRDVGPTVPPVVAVPVAEGQQTLFGPEASGGASDVSGAAAPLAPARPGPTRRRGLVPPWLPWLAGAIVAVVAFTALGLVLVSRSQLVRVPNVTGLTTVAARARLEKAGLRFDVADRLFSATSRANTVLSQRPARGTELRAGSTVSVAVSAGSETFSMPDVVGTTVDGARAVLQQRGLYVTVDAVSSDASEGTVLSSTPSAGVDVQTGESVLLTVAATASATSGLTPADLTGRTFVLDPAPMPAGSAGDTTMDVARRVQALLEASGAKVVVTRSATDQGSALSVTARATAAKESTADALVGFSVAATATEGIDVLGVSGAPGTSVSAASSQTLANDLLGAFRGRFAIVGWGSIPPGSDPIVTATGVAAARVRLGSLASSADRLSFADPQWEDDAASAVYVAIGRIYGAQ